MRFSRLQLSGLSLKIRLLAGSLIWIIGTLLLTGLVLTSLFNAQVERRFDAELATHLDQLLAALQEKPDGSFALARPMTDPRFERPYSALYWQVDGPEGALLRSRSLWDQTLPLPADTPADGEMHRHVIPGPDGQHLVAVERKVDLPGRRDVVRAAVAGDLGIVEGARREFLQAAAVSLGTLALGLVFAVIVQVLSVMRPLGRLQHALATVRLGRAGRLDGRFPSEVQPLVDELNGLIAHNAAVLARARTESGDLAHQLKTPLAIIANAAAVPPDPGSRRIVLDQVNVMQRRIEDALRRARASASGKVLGATTGIGPQLVNLVCAMTTLYGRRGIRIELDDRVRSAVRVEAEDFDELAGNLLDNACKWARSLVRVSADEIAGTVRLAIEDDGPGLPEGERARMFERGRKFDETSPGSGLGLAIVRDLADAYDGGVTLGTSELGGLRAVLTLPSTSFAAPPSKSQ